MNEKVAIVTGATGAIGKAIVRQLAEKNLKVILIARNEDKAKITVNEIKNKTRNVNISYEIVDISLQSEIKAFANAWSGNLSILINNGAIAPIQRVETSEGIEMQFATNVLSYFWMTREFAKFLINSEPSRIVNVASYYAGGLNITDLEYKQRRYNNDSAYRQSKQANRMLTVAFAEKLKAYNITVNSCHPGDVNSKLSNDLGFGGSTSPDDGARTPVWLATAKEVENLTGKYFSNCKEAIDNFSNDKSKIEQLFNLCSEY